MFISNSDSRNLSKRLAELMAASSRLDMLVGFFYFSGLKSLADALNSRPEMTLRVLVGMEAENYCGELVEIIGNSHGKSVNDIHEEFNESLARIVSHKKVDRKAFHERLSLFIDLLESGRLEMRRTRDPNHAKLYVFLMDDNHKMLRERIWITGSSNFSEPGLELRDELNVEISDFGSDYAQQYFDELWNEAVQLTEDAEERDQILTILKDKSLAAAITPYEAYYLVLKNYVAFQQTKLNEAKYERVISEAGFTKYCYQHDAVALALGKLDQYGGVIIADVVGLGKSIIAGLVGAMRRKRGMIICPPGLMGSPNGSSGGWYEYKQKFHLTDWVVCSRGKMEEIEELVRREDDFEIVIVDEAHYFRNPATRDYQCLSNICFGREVVLLTATPFNNRPTDLLALMRLFSGGKNSPFVPGGNIDARFAQFSKRYHNASQLQKAFAKKDVSGINYWLKKCGLALYSVTGNGDFAKARKAAARFSKKLSSDIRQVMEKIVIRRNRIDLVTDPDYKDEITTLSSVHPPKEQFFELTKEQDDFYDRVIYDYFGKDGEFKGAVYRPQEYKADKSGQDDAQNNLYYMMQRMLVRRFESSFGAFRQSLENAIKMMTMCLAFIDRMGCYLYKRKSMDRILLVESDEDAFEVMISEISRLEEDWRNSGKRGNVGDVVYYMDGNGFDGKRFIADIKSDIALLQKVQKEVDRLKLVENDPKTAKLIEVIKSILGGNHPDIPKEKKSPKRKVLLFSEYKDTIRYIASAVSTAFPDRVIHVDSENFTKRLAVKVKKNFDASFEKQLDEYDVLLSSDKLSEGFNLNRAGVVINYDIPWNPTRVIQRVGRINRIGKKVFDNLFIFNFFPTVKGAAITANRVIAETKMFKIHEILGEDAQIFSIDEEPSAANLYDKLTSSFDDDQKLSVYTAMKQKLAKETEFLKRHHPETLNRIDRLPQLVKTAKVGTPSGAVLLRRHGLNFFALSYDSQTDAIGEISLEDAIAALECPFETPALGLSESFWNGADKKSPGIYERLKDYAPSTPPPSNSLDDTHLAINNLSMLRAQIETEELRRFADEVREDLQSFGTIPPYTIKNLAKAATVQVIMEELSKIRATRKADYLSAFKKKADDEEIVVTVELR